MLDNVIESLSRDANTAINIFKGIGCRKNSRACHSPGPRERVKEERRGGQRWSMQRIQRRKYKDLPGSSEDVEEKHVGVEEERKDRRTESKRGGPEILRLREGRSLGLAGPVLYKKALTGLVESP